MIAKFHQLIADGANVRESGDLYHSFTFRLCDGLYTLQDRAPMRQFIKFFVMKYENSVPYGRAVAVAQFAVR